MATSKFIKICIKSDAIVTESAEKALSATNLWETVSQEWAINPADGAAFEWSDILSLQPGIALRRQEADGYGKCTQLEVEVDYTYTPPTPPAEPEYQRRVLMQKQPDGSYKEVSVDYPFEVHDPKALFSMDFWSDFKEEVQLDGDVAATIALGTVTVHDLPDGATIVIAKAMFKFEMKENVHATIANKLDGATVANTSQVIQVADDTPGTYYDAINFVDDQFGIAAETREGGDVIIGSINIAGAGKVDANDGYLFRWLLALADEDYLKFNTCQVGLRIWYEG